MQIPIGGENSREVIIVGGGGTTYDRFFGEEIAVHPFGDTATFEQHLRNHDDHRRIGAILLGGTFPAEPGAESSEQWSQALDVLEEVEAARGEGERIPVTPFSDNAAHNGGMQRRLEAMGQPVLIQNDAMLFSHTEIIAEWVAGELASSQ